MVGANTFRNPALVVKQITTLDHLSDGRAVLGIGGAWFETEHTAFGIDFGTSVGDRLNRLDEAVDLMHGMLRDGQATARGTYYHADGVRNDPPPIQPHLPDRRSVAAASRRRCGPSPATPTCGTSPTPIPKTAAHKVEVLRGHCEEIGRDPAEIELSVSLGPALIRDDDAEAERVIEGIHARNTEMTGRSSTARPRCSPSGSAPIRPPASRTSCTTSRRRTTRRRSTGSRTRSGRSSRSAWNAAVTYSAAASLASARSFARYADAPL